MTYFFRQFSSFVVVGFIATGVHYALLIGLVEIAGVSAVAAALIGYGAGGTVSYSFNRHHVFRTNLPHHAAVSRFTLVAAVGFGLTYVVYVASRQSGGHSVSSGAGRDHRHRHALEFRRP